MADYSDLSTATKAVANPKTKGAALAQIAHAQPSLRPQIADHVNASPGLLTWLDAHGNPATRRAVAARRRQMRAESAAEQRRLGTQAAKGGFKLGWLLGGIGALVVIVAVVVLLVVQPWKAPSSEVTPSGSTVPVLTAAQFAAMVSPEDIEVASAALGAQVSGVYGDNWELFDPTDWDNGPLGYMMEIGSVCAGQNGVNVDSPGIEAMISNGDSPDEGSNTGSTGLVATNTILLVDSEQNATAIINAAGLCNTRVDDGESPETANANGVSVLGFIDGTTLGFGWMQYGNVVVFHDDGGDAVTWADWQAQAATLKQAVDAAA